jgi:uncharacterized membrane protein
MSVVLCRQRGTIRPMQILPEGFMLPSFPYLVAVLIASALVAVSLYRKRPAITEQVVIALAPWMVVGAGLYALEQVGVIPPLLAPLAGAPTVYLTTFVIVGAIFAPVGHRNPTQFTFDSGPGILAITGTFALALVLAVAVSTAFQHPPVNVFWPGLAVVGSVVISGGVWIVARLYGSTVADWTGLAGVLVVFGQTLDGLSTAVGIKILEASEQTPLSAFIIDLGGVGLFVVIKVVISFVVVALLADYAHEEPSEGYLLLAAVAAVGLGPGAHNVILFTIVG